MVEEAAHSVVHVCTRIPAVNTRVRAGGSRPGQGREGSALGGDCHKKQSGSIYADCS